MSNNLKSKDKICILSSDRGEIRTISQEVEPDYKVRSFDTITGFEAELSLESCVAGILDVDSVPLDNRTIRKLKRRFPSVEFLCTSRERVHPQLKEAMSFHIVACLHKPVDPDELLYWLRCIRESEAESKDSPAANR